MNDIKIIIENSFVKFDNEIPKTEKREGVDDGIEKLEYIKKNLKFLADKINNEVNKHIEENNISKEESEKIDVFAGEFMNEKLTDYLKIFL